MHKFNVCILRGLKAHENSLKFDLVFPSNPHQFLAHCIWKIAKPWQFTNNWQIPSSMYGDLFLTVCKIQLIRSPKATQKKIPNPSDAGKIQSPCDFEVVRLTLKRL